MASPARPSSLAWTEGPFRLVQTPKCKYQNDQTSVYTDDCVEVASEMAIVHNSIIRGLNTIYLQAPHVKSSDFRDFIGYCHCWYEVLQAHHHGEENNLFPWIEEAVGEKGIMDVNREQHRAFLSGVEAYKEYLLSLTGNEEVFSGERLCSIIDSFGQELQDHLEEEIVTLLELSKYGQCVKLRQLWEQEGQQTLSRMLRTGALPFFFLNHDVTYEDGLWKDWPPAPAAVKWAIRHIFSWWNAGYWKFASCDTSGVPQPLHVSMR
ncbi:hypothetical protein VTN77DRAFT_7225 [Rasamsonia byssochlamydoides]|uniref:uncharacterized protein n=1 Tax=Rasamsonia byssochlamydoides TaxID=89139 RepID=UPI0037439962